MTFKTVEISYQDSNGESRTEKIGVNEGMTGLFSFPSTGGVIQSRGTCQFSTNSLADFKRQLRKMYDVPIHMVRGSARNW